MATMPSTQAAAQGRTWEQMMIDRQQGERAATEFALPEGATVLRDVAYGEHRLQRLDVYRPAKAQGAPIIVMVHGGAWRLGNKSMGRGVANKVSHWVGKGWLLVSLDYRLLPEARPLEQARDVASALAFV
ncbi:MAG TPA: alpha/beta hydrolase, partial [Burkholderiaceae bacterium]|nr:alpha/beta hydrolase [Burkholderiaceae bacterium]